MIKNPSELDALLSEIMVDYESSSLTTVSPNTASWMISNLKVEISRYF
jgi:hypothetical protein